MAGNSQGVLVQTSRTMGGGVLPLGMFISAKRGDGRGPWGQAEKLEQMAPLRSPAPPLLSEWASCQPKPERTQKTGGLSRGHWDWKQRRRLTGIRAVHWEPDSISALPQGSE